MQQKQQQAINKYNRAVSQYNQKVKQAVNKYNQQVRSHNARVRANQQRLRSEFQRLSRQSTTTVRFTVYRTSVESLHANYKRLDERSEQLAFDPIYNRFLDLSERETANSLSVTNRLFGNENDELAPVEDAEDGELSQQLVAISSELNDRWQGAVFALSPRNPDAARHFCTSAREVMTQILELRAPDADVISVLPNCDKTEQGKPTRRSKIRYFLSKKGLTDESATDFAEADMENIVQLFRVLNDGTHGSAGTFNLEQLVAIKRRVRDGLTFLTDIVSEN